MVGDSHLERAREIIKTARQVQEEKNRQERDNIRQRKRLATGDATLGEKLFILRQRHNLTLKDVQNAMGISDSYLAHIEKGLNQPTIEKLAALAAFYEVTLDELAGHMIQDARNSGQEQIGG